MRGAQIALALALAFAFSLAPAMAQGAGDIYSMKVEPKEPIVFDQVAVSVGVNNPGDSETSYLLEIVVTKDGEILSSIPFEFSLLPGLGTTLTPTFVPRDIGDYEIVARLSDRNQIENMDIQLARVTVVSEIGPFDIAIDAPSGVAAPGTRTPLILTLANMGQKATDVQVRVVMECERGPDVEQEFWIFVFPGAIQDKQIVSDTCNEAGPHDISASIILFNKTWITAVNQIFLNETQVELGFNPPESIMVTAGGSEVFDVEVTNIGDESISNLRLLMPRVPAEWLSITPTRISKVEPDQKVLFIVNITAPRSADPVETDITISAAADQVLDKRDAKFTVVSMQGADAEFVGSSSISSGLPDLSSLMSSQWFYFGLIGLVAVGGFVGGMRMRRPAAGRAYDGLKEHYDELRRAAERRKEERQRHDHY